MSAKHTPGPWRQAKYSPCDIVINERTWIASSRVGMDEIPRDEAIANARLIAAAPDLLAALEHALRDMEDVRTMYEAKAPNTGVLGVSIGLARAAITRATTGD